MPKMRGFQPGGTPNPLLAVKKAVAPAGPTIRDYLNKRDRPTLDDIKKKIEEKESKNKIILEKFDQQQSGLIPQELSYHKEKEKHKHEKKHKKHKKHKKESHDLTLDSNSEESPPETGELPKEHSPPEKRKHEELEEGEIPQDDNNTLNNNNDDKNDSHRKHRKKKHKHASDDEERKKKKKKKKNRHSSDDEDKKKKKKHRSDGSDNDSSKDKKEDDIKNSSKRSGPLKLSDFFKQTKDLEDDTEGI